MQPVSGQISRRKTPPWLIPAIGYGISIACLVWVYHGFDWRSELPRFAAADWRWVTLAVVVDVLVYVVQGWRWTILLKPVTRPAFARAVQSVYIGLFANEVLPFRSGEIIRCYTMARWSRLPFSVTLSSAVIERMMDGFWLIFGYYLVSYFVTLPRYIVRGGVALGAVLAVLAAALIFALVHKQWAHAAVSQSRWSGKLALVVDGLHSMGRSRTFYMAGAVSFLYLALQVVPIFALMQGYGIELAFGAAVVVLLILRMGTILPQAPGNVGAFQFFTVIGLLLFGVDRSTATGFATMAFVVVTLPLWLGGLVAVALAGLKIKDLQRDARASLEPAASIPATASEPRSAP